MICGTAIMSPIVSLSPRLTNQRVPLTIPALHLPADLRARKALTFDGYLIPFSLSFPRSFTGLSFGQPIEKKAFFLLRLFADPPSFVCLPSPPQFVAQRTNMHPLIRSHLR